jgi:hypothetical protein
MTVITISNMIQTWTATGSVLIEHANATFPTSTMMIEAGTVPEMQDTNCTLTHLIA